MSDPIPQTRFHRFDDRGSIADWEAGQNRNWPYRRQLLDLMAEEIAGLKPGGEQIRVVEFCSGPGMAAWHLLHRLPNAVYTGLDFSDPFIDYARQRLARFGHRAAFVHCDLNQDGWQKSLTVPVDACISLQALHDLGSEAQVARIYQEGFQLLGQQGRFINADFVVRPDALSDKDPGRLPVARHLDLLRSVGYCNADLIARQGNFACISACKP